MYRHDVNILSSNILSIPTPFLLFEFEYVVCKMHWLLSKIHKVSIRIALETTRGNVTIMKFINKRKGECNKYLFAH